MSMRNVRWALVLLAALTASADRAWGIGFILGQTKEELKLQYEVAVHDHGDGRASVDFTLADDGRLKPLIAVFLSIPARQPDKGGGYSMDLNVTMELRPGKDGKRWATFEMRKEWVERASIWLHTATLDGKQLGLTSYHHVIPLAKYLKEAPAAAPAPAATTQPVPAPAPAAPPAAGPPATPPPATERKKD